MDNFLLENVSLKSLLQKIREKHQLQHTHRVEENLCTPHWGTWYIQDLTWSVKQRLMNYLAKAKRTTQHTNHIIHPTNLDMQGQSLLASNLLMVIFHQ